MIFQSGGGRGGCGSNCAGQEGGADWAGGRPPLHDHLCLELTTSSLLSLLPSCASSSSVEQASSARGDQGHSSVR